MNDLLLHSYRQAEDYFFSSISSDCMNLADGANAYMTGDAGLNFIYITKNTTPLDKILIQGKHFYDQHNCSFDVIIPQEFCMPEMVEVLNTLGYMQTDKSLSMVLRLDKVVDNNFTSIDNEFKIKENNESLNEWMLPLIGAFESTFEMCTVYAARHESALKKNTSLRHYSLYKETTPIASITLSLNNDIARIDDVGTLPEFQGKGYATHLIRYVLSEAKKLGVSYCFLEASDSGIGIYQKLGFEPLFYNAIYSYNFEQFRKTKVVPYDTVWPTEYQSEKEKIENLFGGSVTAVHHIGSTSVPGLSAKPVIDIMVLVGNILELDNYRTALESLGYHWMGEYGIAGRRYLWRVGGNKVDFHLQCFQFDHLAATNCLVFRDYLRSNPDKAKIYAKEKERSSEKHPNDTHAYWHEKKNVTEELLEEALIWQDKGRP